MNLVGLAIIIVSIFLLTSAYSYLLWPPTTLGDIRFLVGGFYGLGTTGLFLMYKSLAFIKNPHPNIKRAYLQLFFGFILIYVSYLCLETLFWETP